MTRNFPSTPDEFSVDEFIDDDPAVAAALEDAEARTELLNELVRARKDERRVSQRDVAAEMETTQSAVSELESGSTDPRLSTLQRYARAVGSKLITEAARVDVVDTAVNEFAKLDKRRRNHRGTIKTPVKKHVYRRHVQSTGPTEDAWVSGSLHSTLA